ncbi:LPXTG cell wall anchor domain-containing protein [Enterococcus faecalis]|uniref:LPXTG cell wall anchor domain-containing protein n=1 Tax=Enterococcus sp. DIV1059_1 TaxID=2774902 RepID=UPI002B0062E3|nr:LPXTG cell wall anchor domain-containing protein [Enterococcus faecalis]
MKKKIFMSLLLTLSFCFSMFLICLPGFAEEIESNVTVRIIRDDTTESESSKEKDDNSNLEKQKDAEKYKESKSKNRLPQTNEFINSSISIIGTLILLIGILGIYINNKRNGANRNEKN